MPPGPHISDSTTMQAALASIAQPRSSADIKSATAAFIGRVALFSAAVDCIYFLFFLAIGSPLLAWINVLSVSMYLASYQLVQRRRLHLAVILIWLEAYPHAAVGTMMLGWDSGFHYLLLMFIPSVAMTSSRRSLQIFLLALLLFLGSLDFASRLWGPLAPVSATNLVTIKWLNISLFAVMFSMLASYYRQKIAKAERRLEKLATVDVLTGLHNRRYFESTVAQHVAQLRRNQTDSVVVIADIDFFKKINDTFGHHGGDLMLIFVSQLLRNQLREVDAVARWGGEEFVFLMHEATLAEASAILERIRCAIEDSSVSYLGQEMRCTMSFGATKLLASDTLDGAITRADRALYQSKAEGRNRVSAL